MKKAERTNRDISARFYAMRKDIELIEDAMEEVIGEIVFIDYIEHKEMDEGMDVLVMTGWQADGTTILICLYVHEEKDTNSIFWRKEPMLRVVSVEQYDVMFVATLCFENFTGSVVKVVHEEYFSRQ